MHSAVPGLASHSLQQVCGPSDVAVRTGSCLMLLLPSCTHVVTSNTGQKRVEIEPENALPNARHEKDTTHSLQCRLS